MDDFLKIVERVATFFGTDSLTLLCVVLILVISLFILDTVHRFRKSKKIRKNYTPKIGDSAYGYSGSSSVLGEIVEMTTDDVYLKVKVSKKWLYPKEKQNGN